MKNESTIIQLSSEDRASCEEFATARQHDMILYKKRGGFKRDDIVIGGLAEIAVHSLLESKGFFVTEPDFGIYLGHKKSFKADLTDGTHHFHVKGQSQSSRERYGCSWLMQREDPVFNKPDKNYVVPCNVNLDDNSVEVHGILALQGLMNNKCIEECALHWFRKYKVALYMNTIEKKLTPYSRWGFLKRAKVRREA